MSQPGLHPLAEDYLRRLEQAGRQLPSERRGDLVAEIRGHLAEAMPPGTSDHEALQVIERLGPPGEIIEAEQPSGSGPTDRRGWREWSAVILLPFGGFVVGVGWLIGLVLLWSSQLWTTRDKLIGTLVVPGGIASALLVLWLTGTKRTCTTFTRSVNPSAGALGATTTHCTPGGGQSAATTALQIALLVLCVLGPIVVAVYLARRARGGPALVAAPRF